MKLMKFNNILSKDFLIVFLSITPIWLFEYKNFFNVKFLITIFFLILIFKFIVNFLKKSKKINYYNIFLAVIILYGLDSKLGFWLIFEKLIYNNSLLKYFISFIFLTCLFFLIYKLITKFKKFNDLIICFLTALFLINLLPLYFITLVNYELENISVISKTSGIYVYIDCDVF